VRLADFHRLLETATRDNLRTGGVRDVVVAGPGGVYDVVAVRAWHGDVLLEVSKRDGPVPVIRRPRRRKKAAA
jgi:hypothetical protein